MTTSLSMAPDETVTSPTTRIILISTSANEDSVSRALIHQVRSALAIRGAQTCIVDVRELPHALAGCRPYPAAYELLAEEIAASDGVVLSHPIHGYGCPGVTKNFTDIIGSSLAEKPVAFVTAAGSLRSHLAVLPLATSLVMENGCIWFPPTIQVTADTIDLDDTRDRVDELATQFLGFARRFATVG